VASSAQGSDIVWQFIAKDLKVQESGRWCIQLDSQAATLKCVQRLLLLCLACRWLTARLEHGPTYRPSHLSPPCRILRVDERGEMLTEALPGEEELLQRFSAAFNRVRACVRVRA